MSSQANVRTRVLVLSDTHNALPRMTPSDPFWNGLQPNKYNIVPSTPHRIRWPMPKADVLLHAGDLTMNGQLYQHKMALELLRSVDAELKIVIPGNHDLTLDREYYHEHGMLHGVRPPHSDEILDQIEDLYTGEEAVKAGIVYMVEATREFTLQNGATFRVYASAYQPEFYNWAFGYPRDQDRFNEFRESAKDGEIQKTDAANPVPSSGVDIMITHGPPHGILDATHRGEDVGCKHLRRAVERCKPRLHVFGHIHESAGAIRRDWSRASDDEDEIEHPGQTDGEECAAVDAVDLRLGEETLFVNASIMNLRYRPAQPPWLVDVMLPGIPSSEEQT